MISSLLILISEEVIIIINLHKNNILITARLISDRQAEDKFEIVNV